MPPMSLVARAKFYIPAVVRLVLYAGIAWLTAFVTMFKGMSHEAVAAMNAMDWAVAHGELMLAPLLTIRAFLDRTMAEVDEKKEAHDAKQEASHV